MIRFSLPYVYDLAERFEKLAEVKVDTKYVDVFIKIHSARLALEGLMNQSIFAATLRSSRANAINLYEALIGISNNEDFERKLTPVEVFPVANALQIFKTSLIAELNVLPSYFVTPKGCYDTIFLLEDPARLFPIELSAKVPEAMPDLAEAGKALAFDMPTACGFHVLRVTETVLRRYFYMEMNKNTKSVNRNIGTYLNNLTQAGKGDPKIIAALKQLVDLHRNPLMHPEAVLSLEEALAILGISRSVVGAMLIKLPINSKECALEPSEMQIDNSS